MYWKLGILTLFFCFAAAANADSAVTISKQYPLNDVWNVYGTLGHTHAKAFEACPQGWEKLREYTTREDEKYFLRFEIRCLGEKAAVR
mgnify:CR=1 FL=1